MAVMERDTVLLIAAALLLVAVACFLYAWYAMHREESRGHSYEPLRPKEDDED